MAFIKGLIKGLEKLGLEDSLKGKLKSIDTKSGSDINKAIQDLRQFLHNAN